MVGGTIMATLGGLHYWWPKISGRLYNEWLAKIVVAIIFVGFNSLSFRSSSSAISACPGVITRIRRSSSS